VFGPVALALVADLYAQERGEKMGWYSSATLLGRSAAPLAGGAILGAWALEAATGYRWVYLACGASGLLALGLALGLPIRATAPGGSDRLARTWGDTRRGLREVLSHLGILCTSATEAVQYLAYGAVETFLPLYALHIGLSPYRIGLLLGVQVVALTLSKPFMGRLSDRRGRHGQIVLGLWAGAAGLLALPHCGSLWLLLPVSVALGLTMATVTAATAALVSDLARQSSHGAALGTMSAIMDVGHALGPVTAGLLIGAYGYRVGFAAIGLLLAVAGGVFLAAVRPARPGP
jgi:MFS family permease